MSQTSRKLNKESVLNIVNNRKEYGIISKADIGKRLVFSITGSGNDIDVVNKAGEIVMSAADSTQRLQKRIWNINCINALAVENPLNKALLREGIEAEMAGDDDKATEAYNRYLNKITVSVGVLHPLPVALQQMTRGDQVKGTVIMLTPEKDDTKGELLTLDPKTLGAMPVLSAAKNNVPKLSLDDLLGVSDKPLQQTTAGEKTGS